MRPRWLQSFSLCALMPVFALLERATCVPMVEVLSQLASSMTTSLVLQASALFSAATFFMQWSREALVSHLPCSAHASLLLALFSTPSSSFLFSGIILWDPFTHVQENSLLSLLMGLSSLEVGGQSVSPASTLGTCRVPGRVRLTTVAFMCVLRSPTSKTSFLE